MKNALQKLIYLILISAPLFFRIGLAFGNDSIHHGKIPFWKIWWPVIEENWQVILMITFGVIWAGVILLFLWIGYRNRNVRLDIK